MRCTDHTVTTEWSEHGHPLSSYVTVCRDGGEVEWAADTDWGPFDDAIDVARWASRTIRRLIGEPATR